MRPPGLFLSRSPSEADVSSQIFMISFNCGDACVCVAAAEIQEVLIHRNVSIML